MHVVGRSVGWLIFSLALNTHVPFSLAASGGYSPFLPFFFVGPLRWELSVFQNSSTRTSHGPYDVISLFSPVFFHSCFFFFFFHSLSWRVTKFSRHAASSCLLNVTLRTSHASPHSLADSAGAFLPRLPLPWALGPQGEVELTLWHLCHFFIALSVNTK